MNIETIRKRRTALDKVISDWTEDAATPANYVRETGMGVEVARVDRHMHGYQWARDPVVIGWRAQVGHLVRSGIVLVADHKVGPGASDPARNAIKAAMKLADAALKELRS